MSQLRELQSIIEEISKAIMWVNEREEEELVFDWGDKNINQYIPRKQESYSVSLNSHLRDGMLGRIRGIHSLNSSVLMSQQGLMRDLEEKEKELNKLKLKADGLLNNNHPASDKIQVKYFVFVVITSDKPPTRLALLILCALPGLHGHLTDAVELAPPDHQVHPCSSKGECCLQPSKCFFPHLYLCQ